MRFAVSAGVDSPLPPMRTSLDGSSFTMPGLTTLTVNPVPACASARCFAVMMSAALRTDPAMLPVTKAPWPLTPTRRP